MTGLAAITETLAREGSRWKCAGCGEVQVTLGGAAPPPDRRCNACSEAVASPPDPLAQGGVPLALRRIDLSRAAWAAHFARQWPVELNWAGDPWVLMLWGPTGTGKSTAAAVLARETLAAGGRVTWCAGPALAAEINAENAARFGASIAVDRYLEVPWLAIDEPFVRPTWAVLAELSRLVYYRADGSLPTLVTSNLSPVDLVAAEPGVKAPRALGAPPLGSRLLSGRVVNLHGLDARLRRGGK